VTLVDISPVGVGLSEERAREAGVEIEALVMDLEKDPLPLGPWDVIVQSHYLDRALFAQYARVMAPGGLLVVEHPAKSNLLRNAKPGAAYLLEDGELPGLCAGFEVIAYEEGWTEGRYLARLVGRFS
jgi:SAM-dependent methyltransferase